MGNASSSAGTRFIGTDSLPVAQSYKPCHIFGDPDLYGLGIRVGFYLQYFGAVIAIMFGASKEFRIWRASFVVIAAATFIALSVKVTGENLVILDWAIMLQLVLLFPFYFAFPIVFGTVIEHRHIDDRTTLEDIRDEIQSIKEGAVNDLDVTVQRAFADALSARSLLIEHRRLEVVEEAIHRYIDSFGPLDGSPGPQREARGYLEATYPAETQRSIGANFQLARRALAELPGRHVQAIRRLGYSMEQARAMADRVQRVTRWERKANNKLRKVHSILTHVRQLGVVDKVTAGFSLLTYSAYCFLAPWLYFVGIERGVKPGCDVRVLFVFAPVSVYNPSFAIFLRVIACISTVFGLIFFFLGLLLLAIGMIDGIDKGIKKAMAKHRARQAAAANPPTSSSTANLMNPRPSQALIGPTTLGNPPGLRVSPLPPTDPPAEDHPTNREAHEAEALVESWFPRIPYGLVLLLFLAVTVTLVEMTVRVNAVDMARKPFTSTGELIAFLVGLFTLIVIAYNCGKEWATQRRPHAEPSMSVARVQRALHRCLMACCGCLFDTGEDPGGDIYSEDGDAETGRRGGNGPEMREGVARPAASAVITGPRVEELRD